MALLPQGLEPARPGFPQTKCAKGMIGAHSLGPNLRAGQPLAAGPGDLPTTLISFGRQTQNGKETVFGLGTPIRPELRGVPEVFGQGLAGLSVAQRVKLGCVQWGRLDQTVDK